MAEEVSFFSPVRCACESLHCQDSRPLSVSREGGLRELPSPLVVPVLEEAGVPLFGRFSSTSLRSPLARSASHRRAVSSKGHRLAVSKESHCLVGRSRSVSRVGLFLACRSRSISREGHHLACQSRSVSREGPLLACRSRLASKVGAEYGVDCRPVQSSALVFQGDGVSCGADIL